MACGFGDRQFELIPEVLEMRPPQLRGSKTQNFISPKRDKPEAFCSWTSRCERRGSGPHLGTWKAGSPGIRAGSEGEKQSIKRHCDQCFQRKQQFPPASH